MKYRKLSSTGDYTWGNSEKDFYIDVPAAVGQAVKTRLLLWEGEWYLDTDVGTPYLEGIIGRHPQSTADTTVQNQVTGTQGLLDITQYQSTIDPLTRFYSVIMTVNTIYGPTEVDLSNFVNF